MATLLRPNTVYELSQIKEAMAARIRQLPAQASSMDANLKILRCELSIEPVNILYWLHNQETDTKIYWSDRDGAFEAGGTGMADCLKGDGPVDQKEVFAYMRDRLSADNPRLRYYGGMSFDPSCQDREWKKFGACQFIVPRFEIIRSKAQTTFAFNIDADEINSATIDHALAQLDSIDLSPATTYRKPPRVTARADFPDRKQWDRLFDEIRQGIGNRQHEKVVLARRSIFDFDVAIRSCALMKHLKDVTPNCFHFCFQPSADTAFLGATPERLYKRSEQNIASEAIAGTRPRGNTVADDRELEEELLNSAKDAHEHKYVVDTIRAQFELFCRRVKADKAFTLRKLKGSQHLRTSFEGELNEDTLDHEILKTLHPTPAVGGTPMETAMKVIREKEPFGRGWYAGPVGYVGYDKAEFVVAIRSGLINGDQLSLYAGAGIVDGSTSEDEWNEIENKISNFIKVFNTK
ncbi:MAG: isochorismate synthase [Candidatus Omnitrophica bacterium]|nr:isochorismate synthase [Candidatus Omnitrophota bacterium]